MLEKLEMARNAMALAGAAVLTAAIVLPPILRHAKRLRREGAALVLIALGFLYAAATKPARSTFTFETGLRDNGSYSTNSTVHIAWVTTSFIPSSSPIHIEYRAKSDTNGVFAALAETTVGSSPWRTTSFPNATNYNFNIWYDYTPPSPVHTNGVWEYRTTKSRDEKYALPVAAEIQKK